MGDGEHVEAFDLSQEVLQLGLRIKLKDFRADH